jgi:isopenicillin-N epimerase
MNRNAAVPNSATTNEGLLVPVTYLSSAAHPHDTRPGSMVHFFLHSLDVPGRQPVLQYLALLDTFTATLVDPTAGNAFLFDGGMHATVASTVQRMLEVGAVSNFVMAGPDVHALATGSARPTHAAPIFNSLKPEDVVPILPLLLCSPHAPITYAVVEHGSEAIVHINTGIMEEPVGLDASISSSNSAAGYVPRYVRCMRCQLLPPTVLQRQSQSPYVQHLLYRRFLLLRQSESATERQQDMRSGEFEHAPAASAPNARRLSIAERGMRSRRQSLVGGQQAQQQAHTRSMRAMSLMALVAASWWIMVGHRSASSTQTASSSSLSKLPIPPLDEESDVALVAFVQRLVREDIISRRRRQLLVVDTTAGAAAFQEWHSQVLLTAVGSTIKEKLYRALGAVTDLVGAAMSYQPNWTLVAHPAFGRPMRETHFGLRSDIVMLDGNRYGVLPLPVRVARQEWERCVQADPVLWRFKAFPPRLESAIAKLGQRLQVFPGDLQLFGTINHAMATVLRSLPVIPGDKILVFGPTAHAALLSHLTDRLGVIVVTVKLLEPLGDDTELTNHMKSVLQRERPRVVVFQHLQPTGRALPIARMVTESTELDAVSVVDGTDALGNLRFNMAQSGADFYVSRLDGFYFCPIGMSLLYAHPRRQSAVRTLTVSYFHGAGYNREWTYTGLMDMTTWISLLQGLQFQKYLCAGYKDYLVFLANEAHKLLCHSWKVDPIVPLPLTGGIFAVLLPGTKGSGAADALHLQAILATQKVHVGVVPLSLRGGGSALAARVTCQVYNDLVDVKQLAVAVLRHAVTTM